jgi:hypothetical protein
MNLNVIPEEDFSRLLERLDSLEHKIDSLTTTNAGSKLLYSIPDACEFLKVSKRTLQRYRDEGLLSFTQVSGKIMFQGTDIEAFLNGNRVEAFKGRRKS